MGAKVVQIKFNGFGELRMAGIKNTSHEWIFSIDSDERCTPEARKKLYQLSIMKIQKIFTLYQEEIFLWEKKYDFVVGTQITGNLNCSEEEK